MHRNGSNATDIITGPNTPTNFADETASMVVPWNAADFDNDGVIGILDLLDLLGTWGSCPGCPQDLDNDDNVGILDFLQLLAEWGEC